MNCPKCKSDDLVVVDSRPNAGTVRRRRVCNVCGERFSTVEIGKEFYNDCKAALAEKEKRAKNAPVLEQQTADIIMVCKGKHNFGNFSSLKQAVAAYIADRKGVPVNALAQKEINCAIENAALNYMDTLNSGRPSSFVRRVMAVLNMHNNPENRGAVRIDRYEAICIVLRTETGTLKNMCAYGHDDYNAQVVRRVTGLNG